MSVAASASRARNGTGGTNSPFRFFKVSNEVPPLFFYCGSLTSMDLLKTRWMWSEMDDRRTLRGGFVEASIIKLVERMSDLKRSE